jgi:hypothetical protein
VGVVVDAGALGVFAVREKRVGFGSWLKGGVPTAAEQPARKKAPITSKNIIRLFIALDPSETDEKAITK